MKVIQLDENTNVKNIRDWHNLFKETLDVESEVIIDLSMLKRIDLATAQLLLSAGRDARTASKTLKLKSVPAGIRKQLSLCGIG